MHIKPYLRTTMRKSFMKLGVGDPYNLCKNPDYLNCFTEVLPTNFVSQRVTDFADKYDWGSGVWNAGDITYIDFKQAVCEYWSDYTDLRIEQIKPGNGSMMVLVNINRLFLQQGSKVLGNYPTFQEYIAEVIIDGAKYRGVRLIPEENFKFKLDKFLREMTDDYCLIYFVNPDNPAGQLVSLNEIEEVISEAKKKDIVVILDEANAEFTGNKNSGINLINKYDNLIVTRSFGKAYSLHALRVGYGIFPQKLSEYYDKVDRPFSVPVIATHLAIEALQDRGFIQEYRQRVKSSSVKLIKGLREKGYIVSESDECSPYFIMFDKNKDIDLQEYLLSRRIITASGRDFDGLEKNCVRVWVPEKAENFLSRFEKKQNLNQKRI